MIRRVFPVWCVVYNGAFRAAPEASGLGAARRQWQALGKCCNNGMALPARSRKGGPHPASCGVTRARKGVTLSSHACLASDRLRGR
jgi:hypothetical protein